MTEHTLIFSPSDDQGPTKCTSSFGAKLNAIHAGWSIALGGLACLTIWGIQDDLNSSNIDTDQEAISWSFMTVMMLTLLLIMFRFYKNGQWLSPSKNDDPQNRLQRGDKWKKLQKTDTEDNPTAPKTTNDDFEESGAMRSTLEGWLKKGYHDLKTQRMTENFWPTTSMFFCGDCCTDFDITPDDLVNHLANELMLNQHAPIGGHVLQYFLPQGVNLTTTQDIARLDRQLLSAAMLIKRNTQPAISEATHPSTSRAEFFFNEIQIISCCETLVTAALTHESYLKTQEGPDEQTTQKKWQKAWKELFNECDKKRTTAEIETSTTVESSENTQKRITIKELRDNYLLKKKLTHDPKALFENSSTTTDEVLPSHKNSFDSN